MEKEFDLAEYLSGGIRNIVKSAVRGTLRDPKESLFLAGFAAASKKAEAIRKKSAENGENIPPFLIASITSSCNLHCAGCYARENHICHDGAAASQLSCEEWEKIFAEAKKIGISFILLAGGEPLTRKDVIKAAGNFPEIVFPIFTNGTLLDESFLDILDSHRNLIPVISAEGEKETTDRRRGKGVYERVMRSMETMRERSLLFGTSVTVTTENMNEVTSEGFLKNIGESGAKIVFYVEYVPAEKGTENLAPDDECRKMFGERLKNVRGTYPDMIFISFPGDEKATGGCLAAGRGFFHINPDGGAEPCPFSPYSDINVKDTSLKEAINSRLFRALREQNVMDSEHIGGCVLFEKRGAVEAILKG